MPILRALAILPALASISAHDLALHCAFDAYQAAEQRSDPEGICQNAYRVADAYRQAGDPDKFAVWQLLANAECVKADALPPEDAEQRLERQKRDDDHEALCNPTAYAEGLETAPH
jgi:hypothetical protein